MAFNPETLLAKLTSFPAPRRYCVAFSGGVDSHVLLHALVQIRSQLPTTILHAIHVNHGIHPDAAQWARHCEMVCADLNVSFEQHAIVLESAGGESLEALARDARYACFARQIQAGDLLLLAHHQDDQAETLLLQLVRGSGVKGLAGMPGYAPFAAGALARPLLDQQRDDLLAYAVTQQLPWIEDPSNQDTAFDRNFLRHTVLPLMRQRWPSVNASLARAAQHQAEADELLVVLAQQDIAAAAGAETMTLPVSVLQTLSESRQRNLLRYWLHRICRLPLPSTAQLRRILDELLSARADACPLVHWPGAQVRRYRDLLYAMAPFTAIEPDWKRDWDLGGVLALPTGMYLQTQRASGQGLARAKLAQGVRVCFRQGGERCRLPGRTHHHELKKLLQDWGVPPWCRDRVPLVYVGDELVQVVGYAVCAPLAAKPGEDGIEILASAAGSAIETMGENKDNSPGCTP